MGALLKFRARQLPDKTWTVNVPPRLSETGKRQRRFFPTKAAAFSFIEELKSREAYTLVIPELSVPQLYDAAEAFKLLGDRTDVRLADSVRLYLEIEGTRQRSVSLKNLFEQYVATRVKDRSHQYILTLERACRWMAPLHHRLVCDLTREEVLASFEGLSESTRNFLRQMLRVVLGYGQAAGYLKELPIRPIDFRRTNRNREEVQVMTPGDVRQLLETCLASVPDMFPLVLTETFCGVRSAEVARLSWNDIDLLRNRLTIRAAVSKTNAGRTIDLQPVAVAWFGRYIELGHPRTGPFTTLLATGGVSSRMRGLRFMLGYRGKNGAKGEAKTWRPGLLRDTFASCHLAYFDSIDKLLKEMGHTNFAMTRNHYLGAVTKEQASEFWNLFPSSGEKIVQLPVASN